MQKFYWLWTETAVHQNFTVRRKRDRGSGILPGGEGACEQNELPCLRVTANVLECSVDDCQTRGTTNDTGPSTSNSVSHFHAMPVLNAQRPLFIIRTLTSRTARGVQQQVFPLIDSRGLRLHLPVGRPERVVENVRSGVPWESAKIIISDNTALHSGAVHSDEGDPLDTMLLYIMWVDPVDIAGAADFPLWDRNPVPFSGRVMWATQLLEGMVRGWQDVRTTDTKENGTPILLLSEFAEISTLNFQPGTIRMIRRAAGSPYGLNLHIEPSAAATNQEGGVKLVVNIVGEEVLASGYRRKGVNAYGPFARTVGASGENIDGENHNGMHAELDGVHSSRPSRLHPRFPVPWKKNETGVVRYYYIFVCHGGVAYRREDIRLFKCAFCLLKCRSMEGLQCHLTTYHDYCFIFEFEPQDDPPSVCVSTRRSVRRIDGRLWDPEDLSVPPNKEFVVANLKNRRKTAANGMGKGREGKDGSCPSDAVAANAAPMDVENRGESATGADASRLQALPWGHQHEAGSSRPMLQPQGREKNKQSKRVKFPMTEDAGITDDENNREDGAAVGNGEKGWKVKVSKSMRGSAAKMDSAADYRLQIAHADKREGTSPASCREETNEIPWENGRAMVPRSMVLPLNRRKSDLQMTNEERLESREFYHSQTGQRMTREALLGNHDSEDEADHDVLDFEDRFQLNEFTDVSMVEKDFMFMWNSFRRRNNVLADGHMKWACETFAEQHAQKIGNCYPLRIVFTLFLTKMNKYCVINASTVHKAMTFCNKAAAPMPQASPSEMRALLLAGLSKGFSDWVSREHIPNSAAAAAAGGGASSALAPKKMRPAQQPTGGSSH